MMTPMPRFESQFETPEDSPGFMLWRVSNLWQRHIKAALEPLGLTHVQFVLLASLAWMAAGENRSVNQAQLAQHAGLDAMMTSQVLRTLQTKGLVLRNPDPQDARAFNLALSERGLEYANEAMELVEAADKAFFARAKKQKELINALKQLQGV